MNREINGIQVYKIEETETSRAAKLTLANGDIAYACTHDGCEFVSHSLFGVHGSHWRVHMSRPVTAVPYGHLTLGQIIEELADKDHAIARLTSQVDSLADANTKMRAELADLRRLRSAAKRALGA